MPNHQVTVDTRAIAINTSAQSTFTIDAVLSFYEAMNIVPVSDGTGIPSEERIYDFAAESGGATGPVVVNVHHRSVIVGKNIPSSSPLQIDTFFDTFADNAHSELQAIPRERKNGNITYDVFYDHSGGTADVDGQLNVVTLEVLPGELPTVLFTTGNTIATDLVLREVKGLIRVYDYFHLSVQS